jgi:hypothetical protein
MAKSLEPDKNVFAKANVCGMWWVLGFTAAYMAAAVPFALAVGNKEFLFYIVVMIVLIAAIGAVHLRVGLSTGALWALSVWGLLHMAGGLVPVPSDWPIDGAVRVLYSWWLVPGLLKYDQVVHVYGFGVLTWVCWQALRSAIEARGGQARLSFGLLVLCATASMGFGALNEIVEFAATQVFAKTNVGGYENTGWDLVANAVGAVAAAALIRLRAGTTPPQSAVMITT